MTWCLTWWTPSGASEAAVVVAFWAGAVGTGLWACRRVRADRAWVRTAVGARLRDWAGMADEAPLGGGRGSTP